MQAQGALRSGNRGGFRHLSHSVNHTRSITPMSVLNNRLQQFRLLAWVEGLSYLFLLLVAMPMKYFAQQPAWVQVAGMIHGVLFVLFCISAVQATTQLGKPMRWLFRAVLTAFIPFGMVLLDRWMELPQESEA